ncbi:MAG TPA: gamma-glutamylcyclotransferase family protein [Thermodesulfobacteriota bacterium]|nr:gamma-glutamylcyclotransferase family protein [Thermodesulfobacteriota bacterium]
MFRVTWFEEYLLDVVHPEGRRITRRILEDPKATFVWGKLMSPHFIEKLLGHSLPFCPAEIQGYARAPSGDFYALRKKKGATTQGVVLLGLAEGDVAGLNKYEQIPDVMERRRIRVSMGTFKRKAFFYIKKGTP